MLLCNISLTSGSVVRTGSCSSFSPSYEFKNLTNGTIYTYTVTVTNCIGSSNMSGSLMTGSKCCWCLIIYKVATYSLPVQIQHLNNCSWSHIGEAILFLFSLIRSTANYGGGTSDCSIRNFHYYFYFSGGYCYNACHLGHIGSLLA